MHLGIEQHSGTVFEGFNGPELPVIPKPVVSFCKVVDEPSDWQDMPANLHNAINSWLFREDSFDPITRTRRGRVYQRYGNSNPTEFMVPRNPSPDTFGTAISAASHRRLDMYRYMACAPLVSRPNQGKGLVLAIGSSAAASAWKIVQSEVIVTGDVLVTLKAQTAFGVIPELDEVAVPNSALVPVREALERALNSAFRETSVSVVDQCRNAMAAVISHFLASQGEPTNVLGKELQPLANMLTARERSVAAAAAHIVARMHSRGKGNVQAISDAREPIDEDGEFAVHALGLVMRELGWAA